MTINKNNEEQFQKHTMQDEIHYLKTIKAVNVIDVAFQNMIQIKFDKDTYYKIKDLYLGLKPHLDMLDAYFNEPTVELYAEIENQCSHIILENTYYSLAGVFKIANPISTKERKALEQYSRIIKIQANSIVNFFDTFKDERL